MTTNASLCTKNAVTRAEVLSAPTPDHTESWRPMSYAHALAVVENTMDGAGYKLQREQFGLARRGRQLFAALTYDGGLGDRGIAVGLRGSLDKSLSWQLVAGASVFVCDNMVFCGEDIHIMRKNTVNVASGFEALLLRAVRGLGETWERLNSDVEILQARPVSLERGYELLGLGLGTGALTPRVASVAFADWTTPRHGEFAERNLWSLYNGVTEGLKSVAAGNRVEAQVKAHEFFTGPALHVA